MAISREHALARRALGRFGLDDAQLRVLKRSTTTTYRVDTAQGRLVLRLQSTARMPFAVARSELAWLRFLARETSLRTIAPIAAPDGALAALLDGEDEQCAALFRWMAGRHKRRLSPRDAERFGHLLGWLHHYAAHFAPPPDFVRWDFDLGEFLSTTAVIDQLAEQVIAADDKRLLRRAIEQVEGGFRIVESDPAHWGLIHGDVNLSNIRWQDGQPGLIDFEVCCYGPFLFDVGRFLHEVAPFDQNGACAAAFHAGYSTVRPVPPLGSPLVRAFTLMSLLDVAAWLLKLPPTLAHLNPPERLTMVLHDIRRLMDT